MKKNLLASLVVTLLIASVALVSGFSSSPAGYPGKCDRETLWYTAGDTITLGQVLSIDFAYNANTTGSYDTGSVVIRSQVENDTYVAGVALMDAAIGQSVQVITRGVVAAKIDASDSVGGTATALVYGNYLSTADRDGFLGNAEWDSGAGYTAAATNGSTTCKTEHNQACAILMDATIVTTDTGALTTFDVYIDVRSR